MWVDKNPFRIFSLKVLQINAQPLQMYYKITYSIRSFISNVRVPVMKTFNTLGDNIF